MCASPSSPPLPHAPLPYRVQGAHEAVALQIAQQYVEAFGKLAKESNTLLLPVNAGDPAAMVAQVSARTLTGMGKFLLFICHPAPNTIITSFLFPGHVNFQDYNGGQRLGHGSHAAKLVIVVRENFELQFIKTNMISH
jgi:hypothetical protein